MVFTTVNSILHCRTVCIENISSYLWMTATESTGESTYITLNRNSNLNLLPTKLQIIDCKISQYWKWEREKFLFDLVVHIKDWINIKWKKLRRIKCCMMFPSDLKEMKDGYPPCFTIIRFQSFIWGPCICYYNATSIHMYTFVLMLMT